MRRKVDRYPFRMIRDSKSADIASGRYQKVKDNYITPEYIQYLHNKQQNRCIYCAVFMDWINRKGENGLTVERVDVSIGHSKENCVLACLKCNCKKLTHNKKLLTRYFYRWYRHTFDIIPPITNRCSTLV